MPTREAAKFEVVLRVRERQEDLRAQALAQARRDVRNVERRRAELAAQQIDTLQEAGQRARRTFDAKALRLYYQYERHLARLIDEQDAQLVRLRELEEARRLELEEAMIRRRIIERLIARKEHAFQAEVRREEQRFADEVAGNYTARVRRVRAARAVQGARGL